MKLNKLLPIVALSGIASVVAPITACSCGGINTNIINLDDFGSLITGAPPMLHNKNKMNLVKDHTYVANIDMTRWESTTDDYFDFEILSGFENQDSDFVYGQISKANVWVDGIQFTQQPQGVDLKTKEFSIMSSESSDVCFMAVNSDTTTEKSKIKIEFELSDDIDGCYLIFYFG